jgi:hypothetical protein
MNVVFFQDPQRLCLRYLGSGCGFYSIHALPKNSVNGLEEQSKQKVTDLVLHTRRPTHPRRFTTLLHNIELYPTVKLPDVPTNAVILPPSDFESPKYRNR